MKIEVTIDEKPIEDIDPHEFDPMIADTLAQLESLRNNETVDVSLNGDAEEGTD